jgi:hypothetical protein
MNMDALKLDGVGSTSQQDGVVCNADGEILALWANFEAPSSSRPVIAFGFAEVSSFWA